MTTTTTPTEVLPIDELYQPSSIEDLQSLVRSAVAEQQAIYPIGGGTSLHYGLPAREQGVGISLTKLNRVVDYPSEDMTITVEAGITIAELTRVLATNRQRLPIDIPQAEHATLGGVVATNVSGPRRYGYGTMRDHIIGIEAIDAQGERFKGGGRVVKNVAGYDFCRLLTGSLGTLGIITQITLKLSPMVAESRIVSCPLRDWDHAERLLAAVVVSQTTPTAIEVLAGPAWQSDCESMLARPPASGSSQVGMLLVGFEGTSSEVNGMTETLTDEWSALETSTTILPTEETDSMWARLTHFAASQDVALVLKATTLPSAVSQFAEEAVQSDPTCSLQSHAGNGVTILCYADYPSAGLSRMLLSTLAPLAATSGGNVTILSNPSGAEMTKQAVWGGIGVPFKLMTSIKQKFDPQHRLNPGRFVYV